MTPPFITMLAPAHVVVPPLSKVRDVIELNVERLLTVNDAPEGIRVRPVPLMLPPVQLMEFRAVTVCAPPKVPPLRFRIDGDTVPVPSKLAVPPEMTMVLVQV